MRGLHLPQERTSRARMAPVVAGFQHRRLEQVPHPLYQKLLHRLLGVPHEQERDRLPRIPVPQRQHNGRVVQVIGQDRLRRMEDLGPQFAPPVQRQVGGEAEVEPGQLSVHLLRGRPREEPAVHRVRARARRHAVLVQRVVAGIQDVQDVVVVEEVVQAPAVVAMRVGADQPVDRAVLRQPVVLLQVGARGLVPVYAAERRGVAPVDQDVVALELAVAGDAVVARSDPDAVSRPHVQEVDLELGGDGRRRGCARLGRILEGPRGCGAGSEEEDCGEERKGGKGFTHGR